MEMDILYIVIPAYNEAENIEQVVKDWYPIVEKYHGGGKSRLMLINDGSKDNTYEIMLRLAKDRPLLHPLSKPQGGHGAAVLYGYNYALQRGADYIFQTDSDGQTLPEEFHQFWEQRGENSAVIGYRKHRQDGISRIIVTKTLKLVLRMIFGLDIMDANTPFRLMGRNLLEKYIPYVPKDYNLANVMLTVLYLSYDEKVQFIPITFRPRQGGVNSINLCSISKIGVKAIKDFRIMKKNINFNKKFLKIS